MIHWGMETVSVTSLVSYQDDGFYHLPKLSDVLKVALSPSSGRNRGQTEEIFPSENKRGSGSGGMKLVMSVSVAER